MTPRSSHQRLPALDGLRGVAILAVIVSHVADAFPAPAGPFGPITRAVGALAEFGWVGVDLFFALSGYLITESLVDRVGSAGAVAHFYARRVGRIWPLYLSVLALLGLASFLPSFAVDGARWRAEAPWYFAHALNWRLAWARRWAAAPFATAPYWSLGVEEQFYAVWPIVVGSTLRRSRARLRQVCLALWIGSACARLVLLCALPGPGRELAAYVLPVSHFGPIALGAWLAVARRDPATWSRVCVWSTRVSRARAFGTPVIVWWLAFLALLVPEPWTPMLASRLVVGMPLIAASAALAVVIALTAPADGRLGRALRSRTLCTAGQISYGWYLLHPLTLFAVARMQAATPAAVLGWRVTAVVGSGLLAWASWRWWEPRWRDLPVDVLAHASRRVAPTAVRVVRGLRVIGPRRTVGGAGRLPALAGPGNDREALSPRTICASAA